jgi:tyrosyl-tRNA synthetase
MYHGVESADQARTHFEQTVINKEVPDDAPVYDLSADTSERLIDIIKNLGFSSSNGETRRLIQQGGVSINDEKVEDVAMEVLLPSGEEQVLKVGKRKFAILKSS